MRDYESRFLFNMIENPFDIVRCVLYSSHKLSIRFPKGFYNYETYINYYIFTIFIVYVHKQPFCFYDFDWITFDINHAFFWTNKP
jgi:hypothetical protein